MYTYPRITLLDHFLIQDEKDKCDVWLWKKAQHERCVTSFNFEYNTTDQETKEWPGDKVLCAVQFGDYHVLGTMVS